MPKKPATSKTEPKEIETAPSVVDLAAHATTAPAGQTKDPAAVDRLKGLEDVENDPEAFKLKKKLILEAKARKKNAVVKEQYVTLVYVTHTDPKQARKGRKVVLIREMKNGNRHRTFLGWEKKLGDFLAAAKREGKLRAA